MSCALPSTSNICLRIYLHVGAASAALLSVYSVWDRPCFPETVWGRTAFGYPPSGRAGSLTGLSEKVAVLFGAGRPGAVQGRRRRWKEEERNRGKEKCFRSAGSVSRKVRGAKARLGHP